MKAQPLTVYLPDTRGVEVSRYGRGNLKIGMSVFTYSRMPGDASQVALGWRHIFTAGAAIPAQIRGTCPGATEECQKICYASRVVKEQSNQARFGNSVASVWETNTFYKDVPPIPAEAKLLRLHVSGDFDTIKYIHNWIARIAERPDVTVWGYTRSWRVPELLPSLEVLRDMPNVQLFASMDPTCEELPPAGWRRSWIDRSEGREGFPIEKRLGARTALTLDQAIQAPTQGAPLEQQANQIAFDGTASFICPEERDAKMNCEACRYCFDGQVNDVTFIEHFGLGDNE